MILGPCRAALCLALLAALLIGPARAQDPTFTVSGIRVDVSAPTASDARERALGEARQKAARTLFERLTAPEDAGRLPAVSPRLADDLTRTVEIADEVMTANRYAATITVQFHAERVRRTLSDAGVRFVGTGAPPVLIVPVLDAGGRRLLFEEGNAWLRAWADQPRGGLVPIAVPLGDLADLSSLKAEQALAGAPDPILRVARRYGAAEAVVARAEPTADGRITVTVTRVGPDGPRGTDVAAYPGSGDRFREAVAGTRAAIERAWRQGAVASAPAAGGGGMGAGAGDLVVQVRFASLDQWISIRRRLADTSLVTRVDVLALAGDEAHLLLALGDAPERVADALRARGLALEPGEPAWRLGPVGAVAPAAPGPIAPGPADVAPTPLGSPAQTGPSAPGPSAPGMSAPPRAAPAWPAPTQGAPPGAVPAADRRAPVPATAPPATAPLAPPAAGATAPR